MTKRRTRLQVPCGQNEISAADVKVPHWKSGTGFMELRVSLDVGSSLHGPRAELTNFGNRHAGNRHAPVICQD